DLGAVGVFLDRHVAGLLEQREVDVRLDVAVDARIAVPVPGASEVRGAVEDADVGDAELAQARGRQDPAEAGPDYRHLDLVRERRALEPGLGVGILEEALELALDLDVLVVAVRPQALVALRPILLAQSIRIEARLLG